MFFALTIVSCNFKNDKIEEQTVQDQTPELLDNTNNDNKTGSFSKRYKSDIIQQLFEEAKNKDPKLKDITLRISEINNAKTDSLESFNIYNQNNDRYWSSVDNYINQLSDSSIRKEMKEVLNKIESSHKKRMSQHNLAVEKINSRSIILNDQTILMKLFVTERMMNNYQLNELPDIKKLNSIIYSYDTLINETKAYTTIIK